MPMLFQYLGMEGHGRHKVIVREHRQAVLSRYVPQSTNAHVTFDSKWQ